MNVLISFFHVFSCFIFRFPKKVTKRGVHKDKQHEKNLNLGFVIRFHPGRIPKMCGNPRGFQADCSKEITQKSETSRNGGTEITEFHGVVRETEESDA